MADKKISELPDATLPIAAGVKFEAVQGGVNVKVDADDMPGSGGGTWGSITGTLADQTDLNTALGLKAPLASPALTGTPTVPTAAAATNTTQAASTAFVQQELANYVNEEDFATLTFASPTVWANNTRQMPLAKVTASGNFTIDMTSVKSGAQGVLKITSSTASTITLTFDTSFTNLDAITGATLLTYTFPALNGAIYINTFVCDGTTIHWVIGDYFSPAITNPWARLQRAAVQSIGNNDLTVALSIDTENTDNAAIWDSGNPTRMVIVGSGNKIATVSVLLDFASNGASVGVRRGLGYLNGAAAPGAFASKNVESTSVSTTVVATWQIECVAGDYIEIIPYQNSGGNLNVTGRVAIKIESR